MWWLALHSRTCTLVFIGHLQGLVRDYLDGDVMAKMDLVTAVGEGSVTSTPLNKELEAQRRKVTCPRTRS